MPPAMPAVIPPVILAQNASVAQDDYLPVLFMLLFGIVFAVGGLGVSWLLGHRGRQSYSLRRQPKTRYETLISELHRNCSFCRERLDFITCLQVLPTLTYDM